MLLLVISSLPHSMRKVQAGAGGWLVLVQMSESLQTIGFVLRETKSLSFEIMLFNFISISDRPALQQLEWFAFIFSIWPEMTLLTITLPQFGYEKLLMIVLLPCFMVFLPLDVNVNG